MGRIIVLDDDTANRIAAGEVVERPASIVKELVENSIDAGARRITVDLEDGGKRLVRVTDDGCGMDADDAVLALQRFATSKISDAEELAKVLTLGFRGEALPSIAAVSRLRLVTREHEADEGTEVVVEGGELSDVRSTGCAPGTTIEVADLFFNTPARRKFLKVSNTERGHCIDWVQRLALAHPAIAFRVTHDGATGFVSPASGDMKPILTMMYGATSARELLPVTYESPDIRIGGYVSTPRLTRANRTHQHFFINKRFVRSRMISHALSAAYGGLLPAGRQPVCALAIEIATPLVDPNVHPTKIDVRFSRPWEIHHLMEQAVSEALRAADLVGQASFREPPAGKPLRLGDGVSWPAPGPFADRIDEHEEGIEVHAEEPVSAAPAGRLLFEETPELCLAEARVLGQLHNTYIVVDTGDALVLINQHRASERVLFDGAREQGAERMARSQRLTVPVSVELSPGESGAVQDNLGVLVEMGFELEPFGKSAWLIRAIPGFLEGKNYEEAFRGLAEEMAGEDVPPELNARRERMLVTAACHAAVKAGQKLQTREMEQLVRELAQAETPGLCPHGDPTIITLPFAELDRRFERSPRRRR
jgi:DNA mismatch repair protein MutL